jgi:pyrophosphatase PpaX
VSVPPGGFDPVLFDLDGTLIDSVALIRESHRHAVRQVLGKEMPDEALVANVGRPLIEQMRVFSPERAEELLSAYQLWNHANTARVLRPVPGIDELLTDLRASGRTLAVVTSKSHRTVDLAFDILPIRHHFQVVVAADDTERHKPDPAPLCFALERLGRARGDACYVGDAPFDVRAARAAGVGAVAVTWGFFHREALAREQPDLIADSPAELEAALTGP